MLVVSDTSPILYLLLIDQLNLLPRLYQRIIIPDVVQAEMQAPGAPLKLQNWIAKPPPWLQDTNFRASPQLVQDLLDQFS